MIETRFNRLLQEFTSKFDDLKNLFLNATISKITNLFHSVPSYSSAEKPSYAQLVKRIQKIVVKRKDGNQLNSVTNADLMQIIIPATYDFCIGYVKETRDGGIVLGCTGGVANLKEIVDKKLSSKYDVHLLKSFHLQIHIVGRSESFDNQTLVHYLLRRNSDVFSVNSDLKVIRSWRTKKKTRCLPAFVASRYTIF